MEVDKYPHKIFVMRKNFLTYIILCVILIFSFSLTVCAEKEKGKEDADKEAEDNDDMTVINILGDSITEGYALDNPMDGYAYQLENFPGIKVNNYGLSGSAVGGNNVDRFLDRYPCMDNSADIILVFGGTNDFNGAGNGSTKLGHPGSQDSLDFYCGYGTMIAGILKEYPDSQLVLVTPITREGYQVKNRYGYTLKDYAHAISIMGMAFKVPVIDLFHDKNVNFAGSWDYLSDGLHPTPAGHKILAQEIYDALKTQGLIE